MVATFPQEPDELRCHKDCINTVLFHSKLVGSTFFSDAQPLLKALKDSNSPFTLHITPDQNNSYDPYATFIEVSIPSSPRRRVIGHVPQEQSYFFSYLLNHSSTYSFTILNVQLRGGTSDKPFIGLFFDFNVRKIS